jgi:hypothetical protein
MADRAGLPPAPPEFVAIGAGRLAHGGGQPAAMPSSSVSVTLPS